MYALGKLAATGLAITFLIGCGSGGAEPTPVPVALTADVCTEGEARDTKLHIKNLDDFEWRDITFSLVKADATYAREWPSLSPESLRAAEPITDSLEFTSLGDLDYDPFWDAQPGRPIPAVLRLHNFSSLESAKIVISAPQPGEWAGEVQPCQ